MVTDKRYSMTEAAIFKYQQNSYTMNFAQENAFLPVKLKNGAIKLVRWGRRIAENSEMPLGGWAKLNSLINLRQSQWSMYLPKPVQLPIDKFMERDFEGHACWYEVTKGKALQGLLANIDQEYRVYIVTIDPEDLMNVHYRWPRIIVECKAISL